MKLIRTVPLLFALALLFVQCKKDKIYVYQSDWTTKNFSDWTLSDNNTRLTTIIQAPEITAEKMSRSNINVYLKMQNNITAIPTRLLDGMLIMTEISPGQIKIILQYHTIIEDFETAQFRYVIEH
jgi:hypothetical protein